MTYPNFTNIVYTFYTQDSIGCGWFKLPLLTSLTSKLQDRYIYKAVEEARFPNSSLKGFHNSGCLARHVVSCCLCWNLHHKICKSTWTQLSPQALMVENLVESTITVQKWSLQMASKSSGRISHPGITAVLVREIKRERVRVSTRQSSHPLGTDEPSIHVDSASRFCCYDVSKHFSSGSRPMHRLEVFTRFIPCVIEDCWTTLTLGPPTNIRNCSS